MKKRFNKDDFLKRVLLQVITCMFAAMLSLSFTGCMHKDVNVPASEGDVHGDKDDDIDDIDDDDVDDIDDEINKGLDDLDDELDDIDDEIDDDLDDIYDEVEDYNNSGVSKNENDPSGFVLLSDVVPDVIQEIRYYSTYNFVGDRIDGYEEPCALMTKEAAEALKKASDEAISKGYRLKIYDAYRPQRAVDNFVSWAEDLDDTRMKKYFYPDLDKSVLFDQGYIAAKSGHSRGSTVDLTLFDMNTEKEVDMGGTFDYFGIESHPDYKGKDLSKQQYKNRMILKKIMVGNGFEPLETEWWHFTLKDEPYPDTFFKFPVDADVVDKD